MKYRIQPTTQFKKDMKRIQGSGWEIGRISAVINTLAAGTKLDEKHQDHPLHGNYKKHRDCHILPDWILIYQLDEVSATLRLIRTGTHSELY